MKNYIFGFIALIIILTMYSCKGKLMGEFYLSSEMKAQIPFKGGEIIYFIDSNGKTYSLKAGEKYNEVFEYPMCNSCKDYSIYEREWIIVSDETYKMLLKMSSGTDMYSFSIEYSINGIGFDCSFRSPLSQDNLRINELYYDSLVVNNKTYHNVFSDTLTHIGSIGIDPYPVRCYYSTEFGIVKISFSDSTSWELKNIEW